MSKNVFRAAARLAFVCVISLSALSLSTAFAATQEEADAKFAAGDWLAAASDYRALLAEDGANAQNWYNLGAALFALEDYAGAKRAYRAAIDAGYARIPRARVQLARIAMAEGRRKDALKELEKVAQSGAPSGRYLRELPDFAPLLDDERFKKVVHALTPCADGHHRDFDFWLGEWDVYGNGSQTPTASSRISIREEGCVIFEEYSVAGAFSGVSINFYDPAKEKWHQTWMSSSAGSVYIEGGVNLDGAMVLTDDGLDIAKITGVLNRVTWTPNPDGTVRQFWESSSDGGATWSVAFDGLYKKKKAAE